MSYKLKNTPAAEVVTCEKYISRLLKNEKMFPAKRAANSAPTSQDKHSNVNNQRTKQKFTTTRSPNPVKPTPTAPNNKPKEVDNPSNAEHRRQRSTPRCRSISSDRESWGKLLHKNLSQDKISSTFSMFDPLRTVHFLSRELYNKLQTLLPDDDSVIQMISDIQHALRRMPSEVSTALPEQQLEQFDYIKPPTDDKICQTPPTLYQEDTEKFQKIMEENTFRLEASCQQLEMVCLNLQREKELTEKELEEARDNVDLLIKRVKELEQQSSVDSQTRIQQLECENENLQLELDKALQEKLNSGNVRMLKKHIEELQKEKSASDENCTRLEYDITLLKMEKEKFMTMLSVRDREIKDIQGEMSRIQEQVNNQLKKLNVEISPKINYLKNQSDPSSSIKETKIFAEIGDSTISSIKTNDSETEQLHKEFPSGDAKVPPLSHDFEDNVMKKLKKIKSINNELLSEKRDSSFEELLNGLSPSCRTLLTTPNNY